MSGWDSSGADGGAWTSGGAAQNSDNESDSGMKTPTQATMGGASGDSGCRICNQPGHFARDCPDKPEGSGMTGGCFNCGEEGHNKADCTKPRVFKGACRVCNKEGHPAAECPDKPPPACRNCKQEGHIAQDCDNNRVFDRDHLPTVSVEAAWDLIVKADGERNVDDFRIAIQVYAKAYNQVTYRAIEESLRESGSNIHIIALEAKLLKTQTLINLQGEKDRTYQVTYQFSETPTRKRIASAWPKDRDENLQRLNNAGLPYDRGLPYCLRCKEIGHISKNCPEEEVPVERVKIMCVNCDEEGHRVRDCPKDRKVRGGPMTCRNCGQEGHKKDECEEPPNMDNVTCRKCEQTGHFAKECPNEKCRNCDQPGHNSRECTEPRNPATVTCRNCDEVGHFSRDCPKPRDYSRVECSNCHQMGHTKVRCKEPVADDEDGGGVPVNGDSELVSFDDSKTSGEDAWAKPAEDDMPPAESSGGSW